MAHDGRTELGERIKKEKKIQFWGNAPEKLCFKS